MVKRLLINKNMFIKNYKVKKLLNSLLTFDFIKIYKIIIETIKNNVFNCKKPFC